MLKSATALLIDRCQTKSPNNTSRDAWKQQLSNWGAFAAATGAALAMSTNASASIIASNPDFDLAVTLPSPLHSNHVVFTVGGAVEFLELDNNTTGAGARNAGARFISLPNHMHLYFRVSVSPGSARRYAMGQPIFPHSGAAGTAALLWGKTRTSEGDVRLAGNFGPGASQGFLGFSNAAGDLGWLQVRVSFDNDDFPSQLELISFAYNDVPGPAISAGQTAATPEPGTAGLALLALGAAGILALRKRRNQLAAK